MGDFTLDGRLVAAHITFHKNGSMMHKQYGEKSLTVKLADVGLPTDTHEDCVTAAKKIIAAAIAAKLPCSGIFFASLHEAQEKTPKTGQEAAKALKEALELGQDVWLSKRGKLVVGTNTTGMKAKGQSTHTAPTLSAAEDAALAAFLKA